MDVQAKLTQLKSILREAYDLGGVMNLLHWDQQTYMPSGGVEARSQQMSTLSRLVHLRLTAPELGELLDVLQPYAAGLDPLSDDACLVKVTRRVYDQKTKVPADFMAEFSRITSLGHQIWEKARAESDFKAFCPILKNIIDLCRQMAEFFAPYEHVYDPLLDKFEPGMKTAEVKEIFSWLRPRQVELVKAIGERPQVEANFLYQSYPESKQWDFGVEVISKFGFDWNKGRQDRAVHPFTAGPGQGDIRITTRFLPDYVGSAMFSTMHECGHGLYGMGVDPKLDGTPLDFEISMALHESQSRMYENLVGRSRDFWYHFYPRLQQYYPEQLGNVGMEKFYKGINRVQPSLIRVEADEATYNLHVMLRLELEIALMERTLEVEDLPEAWNARMREYLGLTPPNDAQGVLQDVHWSNGYVGYFATYTLGNLVSVQLWEKLNNDIPNLSDQIRCGEFADLTEWLRQKVHRHGGKFEAQELVMQITGSKIDPAPYMRYLQTKYGDIYGL